MIPSTLKGFSPLPVSYWCCGNILVSYTGGGRFKYVTNMFLSVILVESVNTFRKRLNDPLPFSSTLPNTVSKNIHFPGILSKKHLIPLLLTTSTVVLKIEFMFLRELGLDILRDPRSVFIFHCNSHIVAFFGISIFYEAKNSKRRKFEWLLTLWY